MKSFFSKIEEEILKFWKENKIFEKSIEQRDKKKSYVFYDGPPFATGLPHYGHIVASAMKDIVPRYWTMKGYRVERKWGWDCHGLPIENLIEKELNLKSKKDIEKLGVDKFNEACEASVLRYAKEWKEIIERMGRWVDMENDYKTMDSKYMESVWWVFKSLWDKGLIYQDYKSMHICPRCETTLSNFEVTLEYKDIKDLSLIAKFELIDEPNVFVLAWTTTPWTLPGNVALAINDKIIYVKIKKSKLKNNEYYIIAKNRVNEILKNEPYEIIEEFEAQKLINKKYKPLFNYFNNDETKNIENAFKIYSADFVSAEDGTGIVHIASAFGEDDMNLGKKNNLPFIQHVKMDGRFVDKITDFVDMEVKPKDNHQITDIEIIKYLAKNNLLFSKEKYEHSYPHCWRCDTPLLNYATNSWFVKVTEIKDKMIKNNQEMNWIPEHIKNGRFGKWLENAKDWAISRSRYWGTVLPVWVCDNQKNKKTKKQKNNCGNIKVIGSIKELEKLSKQKVENLHKHIIDKIEFKCEKCGGMMKRIPEVFDCWFESGSMPYAQEHYPFENKEKFEKNFPAQFIAEGQDQTRGWFYTLIILSTALFDKPAFKNVIVNGMVLAEDGKKMAKNLKNYPDPKEIFEKYSADAMRFYLACSSVMKANNLCFSEKGVDEASKKILNILWNVHSFFELYAKSSDLSRWSSGLRYSSEQTNHILDKWILVKLNLLIKEVTENMDNYEIARGCRFFENFINELSTWYIRRSRDRFKEIDKNNLQPLIILHHILLTLSKLMAPFTPFIAEKIYQNLITYKLQVGVQYIEPLLSVHLCDWPECNEKLIDKELIEQMDLVRLICEIGHSLRVEAKIKVRQPLASLKIKNQKLVLSEAEGSKIKNNEDLLHLIQEELNVREVKIVEEILEEEDWKISNNEKIKMALNIKMTPELKQEGLLREIIRQINAFRKEIGLTIEDKINLYYCLEQGETKEVFEKFEKEIKKATICSQLIDGFKKEEIDFEKEIEIEDQKIWIGMIKITKSQKQ
ncbi:MAG: isoleucine--tRNA ligase [Candidatus Kuenenbacteria bacterium]